MTISDHVRQHVFESYLDPAHKAGRSEVTVRAGDIHKDLNFENRIPLVCSAIGSKIFQSEFDLELTHRTGPTQGANATFVFRLLGNNAKNYIGPAAALQSPPTNRKAITAQTSARRLFLVSCVKTKSPTPKPAEEFYTSDWFSKARRYVETTGSPWFILSAKYGLVSPETVLEPYEKTLNTMPVADRRRWAEGVFEDLVKVAPELEAVAVLAGAKYREFLAGHLSNQGVSIEVPMEGLAFGEQLAWLGSGGRSG